MEYRNPSFVTGVTRSAPFAGASETCARDVELPDAEEARGSITAARLNINNAVGPVVKTDHDVEHAAKVALGVVVLQRHELRSGTLLAVYNGGQKSGVQGARRVAMVLILEQSRYLPEGRRKRS